MDCNNEKVDQILRQLKMGKDKLFIEHTCRVNRKRIKEVARLYGRAFQERLAIRWQGMLGQL